MSKLAVHVAHFKKSAVGGIAGHNFYKRGEKDEHSNQDIDTSRSHLNIPMIVPPDGFYSTVKEKVDGSVGRVTAASIWVTEWIVYPPENLQNPLTADRQELQKYYTDVQGWMRSRGYDPVMSVIHRDETTVHAHIDTVPLTEDGRLSRKDVYTRSALNSIHTDLAKFLAGKGWDIQRGESTKGKGVKAKDVKEFKKAADAEKEQLVAELKSLDQEKEAAQNELTGLQSEVVMLKADATLLEVQTREIQAEIEKQEAMVERHEEALDLIQDYDQYLDESDEVDLQLDQLEDMAQTVPDAAWDFKVGDKDGWIAWMDQLLLRLREFIDPNIRRLQIFEEVHQVQPERRTSPPLQQRARSLDQMISGAAKVSQKQAAKPVPRRTGRSDADTWKKEIWAINREVKSIKETWYADREARWQERSEAWERKNELRKAYKATQPYWERYIDLDEDLEPIVKYRRIESTFSEDEQDRAWRAFNMANDEYSRMASEAKLPGKATKVLTQYRNLALEVADDPDATQEEIERALDRYRKAVRVLQTPERGTVKQMEREFSDLKKSLEYRAAKRQQHNDLLR